MFKGLYNGYLLQKIFIKFFLSMHSKDRIANVKLSNSKSLYRPIVNCILFISGEYRGHAHQVDLIIEYYYYPAGKQVLLLPPPVAYSPHNDNIYPLFLDNRYM